MQTYTWMSFSVGSDSYSTFSRTKGFQLHWQSVPDERRRKMPRELHISVARDINLEVIVRTRLIHRVGTEN